MNQNDRMREALQFVVTVELATRAGDKYCTDADRAMALAMCAATAQQALAAEPAPLVRLTDDELNEIRQACHGKLNFVTLSQFKAVASAIMDAMEEKNK